MTAEAPEQYIIEFDVDLPVEKVESDSASYDFIIEVGNTTITGEPAVPEIIEVFAVPPVGGGVDRVETIPFTRQGALSVGGQNSEFPIVGAIYELETIAARVSIPSAGSSIILDIFQNDVSIFSNPAHRPTIAAGQNLAVVTVPSGVVFDDGDWLEVGSVQVGSTTPGSNLVMSIRLTRIG